MTVTQVSPDEEMLDNLMWTASSTNTIKRDSFKSKSSSGLNSLYTTFNIQEPPKLRGTTDDKRRAVFTLESLFGSSSQNTFADDRTSIGTDASSVGNFESSSRRVDSFHSADSRRHRSARRDKRHKRLFLTSNSQTIHNVDLSNSYNNSRSRKVPMSLSSSSMVGRTASLSLPRLQGADDAETVEQTNCSELSCDELSSSSQEGRRKTLDNISISTTYSSVWGAYSVSL